MTHCKSYVVFFLFALGCSSVPSVPQNGNDAGFDLARCASDEFAPCADERCCVLRACEGVGVCSNGGNDAGTDVPVVDAGNDVGNDAQPDAGPVVEDECRFASDCPDVANPCMLPLLCVRGEDGVKRCVPQGEVSCDDGIACTTDICDPATGCRSFGNDALCEGDLHCEPDPDGAGPGIGRGCICYTDADCADEGLACNGKPECRDNACEDGEAPSCEDGNPCTVGFCVEDGHGGFQCPQATLADCEPACRDGEIRPCIVCSNVGFQTCSAGVFDACQAPEICDGCDNDLDGVADNDPDAGMECARGSNVACVTSCGSTGSQRCNPACQLDACQAPAESCNGSDDDCDGIVDNGYTCIPGATRACSTRCGSNSIQTCGASCEWEPCNPGPEVCNGRDDDCDGGRDTGFVCAVGEFSRCVTDCGSDGIRECGESCVWGLCYPAHGEVCGNFSDDDCDPATPDRCQPPAPSEICNGLDDNGDGVRDNGPGFECVNGSVEPDSCLTRCLSYGGTPCEACRQNRNPDACIPPAESCNGYDDDCDGSSDEGFACRRYSSANCTTSCGTTGRQSCNSDCSWGACVPPVESCNGRDDNCNGVADEGFSCLPGASRSCITSCGSTGVQACGATCAWGACVPPAEICGNARDENCNGVPDDGCPGPACIPSGSPLNSNSGFESGLANWSVESYRDDPPRACSCSVGPVAPDGSATVSCTADANSFSYCQLKYVFPAGVIQGGRQYEVVVDVSANRRQTMWFQLLANDGGPYDPANSDGGLFQEHLAEANVWTRRTFCFTASARNITPSSQPRLTVHLGGLSGGTATFNIYALRSTM